jgi:lysophospholipase L1-like esterase
MKIHNVSLAPLRSFWMFSFILMSGLVVGAPAPEQKPFLKPGERWCALGDSITRGGGYHKEVELFYLTRYPDKGLEVINCGVSGDSAGGVLKRLGWDCLDHKPTVVSVMLGMNDVNRDLYDASNSLIPGIKERRDAVNAAYLANLEQLASRLKNSGARLILITPSIFDDTGNLKGTNKPGCAAALTGYAVKVAELAGSTSAMLVDFNGPMTSINTAMQKTNGSATLVGDDRIHPGPVGHFVMAYEFLKADQPRSVVAEIGIDAALGKPSGCDNCEVSKINSSPDELSFTCLEKALPFPVTEESKPALGVVPFTDEFNREILRVTGLSSGTYRLTIDGKPIRDFTDKQLFSGVNLASEKTPQTEQATQVRKILGAKWDAEDKLRTIAFVELHVLPTASRPLDAQQYETINRSITEELLKPSPSDGAGRYTYAMFQKYAEVKPKEKDSRLAIVDSLSEARVAAKPLTHNFVITKVGPGAASSL